MLGLVKIMSWFANRARPQQARVGGAAEPEAREPHEASEPVADPAPPAQVPEEKEIIWQRPVEGPVWPPLVETDAAGTNRDGAGLDRLYFDGEILVLTGWTCGDATLGFHSGKEPIAPILRVEVPRPDVATAYAFSNPVTGYLCLWRGPFPEGAKVHAKAGGRKQKSVAPQDFAASELEPDLSRILREYAPARGVLFDALRDLPDLLRAVAWSAAPSHRPGDPRGYIDILKTVPDAGGLCVGWSLGRADFFVVDDRGACLDLAGALRWNRPDIFDGFSADYGADCAEAGFLQALPPTARGGSVVRLLARAGDDLILLHERTSEPAPLDAVGYARWAFSLPVPPERMVERFAAHDGPLLQRLIARMRQHPRNQPLVRRIGPVAAEPEVSLLIPLFGRYDFVDHQLLEFADDAFIREHCEVLYIVDDPNIAQPVQSAMERWWQLYRVPLTVVWGGRNRGFSGANNLGLSVARGRQILFLNSDVIPTAPGWLDALSARLDDNPDYALLGTRLLFPSGGVQHDGMTFEYSPAYGVYLNQHPGKGLAAGPAPEGAIVDQAAATGACLIGHRAELLELGGFCEDYLIGDFEDSHLCLTAEAAGRRVGVCPDIALTHLERQSLGLFGSGDFRVRVMLFNAWLHQERWREALGRHAMHGMAGERL
ncbi:glycosyltransferase [Xanthobacter autotrophicus]|uniref:glycosyltransferase family 2 protein n=1 Tax=Xanthobacter TaxID=279 RepID=UPI0024AA1C8A|nr:glycosyltransferase [Xanthobacter autotrophicus]MDI4663229.1 glycosyltransferase [Xanthobacter autotrophicus]